jgi:hypothetical protein
MLLRFRLSVAPRFLWVGMSSGAPAWKVEGYRPRPFGLRGGFTIPPRLRFPRPPYNAGQPYFTGAV